MKDILENLNKPPYKVPERYFETFADRVRPWERKSPGRFRNAVSFLSIAAVFAVIAATGTTIMKFMTPEDELQEYGSPLYCELVPYTETVYYSYSDGPEEVSENDIIEYLIYNGTSADDMEYIK